MADASPQRVKELREKTGAGMMDCKVALIEAAGDMEKAIEVLRKKGLKDLGKRSGKVAAEGMIGVYSHPGDQVVAIVELNCETDFVARNEEFRALARDLAMHVAAMKPSYVSEEDVPPQVVEKEKEIAIAQLSDGQRAKAEQILPGKLKKFYEDVCLLRQNFVKDDSGKVTVADIVNALGAKMGEKIVVRRVQRFEVGEGIQRAQTDLARDVAALTAGA